MAFPGRKTLKSGRLRMRRIDMTFEFMARTLLILYFVFVFLSWLSYREAFRINNVIVEGTKTSNPDSIRALANEYLSQRLLWKIDRNNAIFYPKDNLALALSSIDPHIKNITMEVVDKKNLSISVTEFTPVYLWCNIDTATTTSKMSECHLADDEGYIYARSPGYSGYPFPVFYTNIPGYEEQGSPIELYILPQDEFSKIKTMMTELYKIGINVNQIDQTDETDYMLTTDRSWVLLWSSLREPVKSVENLSLVLDDIKKRERATTTATSIDLRFGNKIFYK